MTDPTRFFVTGGTLALDAPSYVERHADTALFEGLSRSEFCYVLTPRQMGKSSLMVRTAARLREHGVTVVILDLTMVGQLLTQEQWYYGLLQALGSQLRLREPLKRFWLENPLLGPLQRWMAALREVVLPSLGVQVVGWSGGQARTPDHETPDHLTTEHRAQRLVVFIDEIDAVRSLPFSTDELFAAIRECYNRRPHDPAMHRLTFCLVGVATPSDLIQDARTTPFNIGVRVELEDFSDREAAPLTAGLVVGRAESLGRSPDEARQILHRILHWTSGHPYLTQRLCQAMVETASERGTAGVDHICNELFLAPGARERDDNLILVRERLLRTEGDLGGLLELYSRVWRGKRVKDNALQPAIVTLRLSGIVKSIDRHLVVRNRIYARAFDREWIREVMPGGELRRQRSAFRQGMLRAGLVFGAVVAAVLASIFGFQQFKRAEVRGEALRLNRYGVDIGLAQQAIRSGELEKARTLLDGYLPKRGKADLRGFEWHYLRAVAQQNHIIQTLKLTALHDLHYAGDHTLLATSGFYDFKTFDDRTGAVLSEHAGPARIHKEAFSNSRFIGNSPTLTADCRWLTRCTGPMVPGKRGQGNWTVEVAKVGAEEGIELCRFFGWPGGSPALSPDGSLLALCRREARVPIGVPAVLELWDVRSRKRLSSIILPKLQAWNPTFSPDGRQLALALEGGVVQIWRVSSTGIQPGPFVLSGHLPRARVCKFSADSKLLAVGTGVTFGDPEKPGLVMLWDLPRRALKGVLAGHTAAVHYLDLSRDGRLAVTGGRDRSVRIWDLSRRIEVASLTDLPHHPAGLAISPDSSRLAVALPGGRYHFLDLPRPENSVSLTPMSPIWSVKFLPRTAGQALGRLPQGSALRYQNTVFVDTHNPVHVRHRAFSPQLDRFVRTHKNEIEIRDLANSHSQSFKLPAELWTAPLFASNSDQLLLGDRYGSVYWFNSRNGGREEILRLKGSTRMLAINSSNTVAALSSKGQLLLHIPGQPPRTLRAGGAQTPISVSDDGTRISFMDSSGIVVRVVATGQEIQVPISSGDSPSQGVQAAICPGNRTIAISSPPERAIHLNSLRTGAELATIRHLPAEVTSLDFNTQGSRLAIGCRDGSVVLVPPDP